jgi:hypothetical protein
MLTVRSEIGPYRRSITSYLLLLKIITHGRRRSSELPTKKGIFADLRLFMGGTISFRPGVPITDIKVCPCLVGPVHVKRKNTVEVRCSL